MSCRRVRRPGLELALLLVLLPAALACNNNSGSPSEPALLLSTPGSAALQGAPPSDHFSGILASADVAAASFTLEDGTTIVTDAGTRWKAGGPRLASVQALADAATAGIRVDIRGKASGTPLIAEDVDAKVTGQAGLTPFNGEAASTALDTVMLTDGTVVQVNGVTQWKNQANRLVSIAEIAQAIAAGAGVDVHGKGSAQADGSVLALNIDAKLQQSSVQPFTGFVVAADDVASALMLASGLVVNILPTTRWKQGPNRLGEISTIAEALAAGIGVEVHGKGTTQPDGSISASKVDVRVQRPTLSKFSGEVVAADALANSMQLEDGTILTAYAGTEWKSSGRHLGSLTAVVVAIGAGDRVLVGGQGVPQADGTIVIARIRARSR